MGVLAQVTNYLSLVSALLLVAVGAIHVGNQFAYWCENDSANVASTGVNKECVGPWLIWTANNGVTERDFISDTNGAITHNYFSNQIGFVVYGNWRSMFNLKPRIFVDLWTPLVMGFASVSFHIAEMVWEPATSSWARFCVWNTIAALWGAFGYTGSLGVINGFMLVLVALLCVFTSVLDPESTPSLKIPIKYFAGINLERSPSAQQLSVNVPSGEAASA